MREKLRTAFAERLLEARTRAGLSQPQLAKLTGVSQGTIGEAETTAIGSKHTARLAVVLGVRAEWLSTGEGPMLDADTWPFKRIDIARVLMLNPEALAYLEGRLESALETAEGLANHHVSSPSGSAIRGVPARFPGQLLSTEQAQGKQGEVKAHRLAEASSARGRKRT